MEDNRLIEVVKGNIRNRNNVMSYKDYLEVEKENYFGTEMYRSYYLFDNTLQNHVVLSKSVRKFDGLAYLDRILIDIDKG